MADRRARSAQAARSGLAPVAAPAWPAHPAWLAKFLDVLGTRTTHEAAAGANR